MDPNVNMTCCWVPADAIQGAAGAGETEPQAETKPMKMPKSGEGEILNLLNNYILVIFIMLWKTSLTPLLRAKHPANISQEIKDILFSKASAERIDRLLEGVVASRLFDGVEEAEEGEE